MKEPRASSFALCLGLALLLGLGLAPAMTVAADTQPIVGDWEGTLDPGAQHRKRMLVHISAEQDGSLSGTIDYPDENASGMQITAINYKELTLHLESNQIQASYDGTMNKDNSEIKGDWKQGGVGLNLILKRTP